MDDVTPQGEVCGPDGCEVPATGFSAAPAVGTRIDIVSDAICPWCYIGKRQLERALAQLATEGLTFSVHWNPFQLNPDMPKEGRDRAAYRAWKFGSADKAVALDQRITEAAAGVGLAFRTDLMTLTPNTIDAHRLIWFAGQNGVQDAVMEAVFKAYFIAGRDIGDHATLADCAAEAGLDHGDVMQFLASDLADKVVLPGRLRVILRCDAGRDDCQRIAAGTFGASGEAGGLGGRVFSSRRCVRRSLTSGDGLS
jgi:predicted DsbA family dithiol-disulfide isomerase